MQGQKLLINSIYRATEGEGIHLGQPRVFVRFQGCQVGCLNCDSKETWPFAKKFAMDMEQVLQRVDEQAAGTISWISLTGGDPLDPQHGSGPMRLVDGLKLKGYKINLEAAGDRIVPGIFAAVDFISFDYKPPSTGVDFPLEPLWQLCRDYPGKFQIKSVAQDAGDFHACLEVYQKLQGDGLAQNFEWCLTPAYSPHEEFNPGRFVEIMDLNIRHGSHFRVVGQQHKWVYGSRAKRV